jgi:NADH-quinone oxidoreductase subunit E
MGKKGAKSAFVGLRISDEASRKLSKVQEKAKLNKTEVLLRGLELVEEYYSLGLDRQPLGVELRELQRQARHHAESLRRIRSREQAIKEMAGELRAVDEIVDRHGCKDNALIQILLAVQAQNRWLPQHALVWIAERLQIPIARIYQIANFYEAFTLEPRGKHLFQVCTGTACYVRGAPLLLERMSQVLGLQPGETDPQQMFTLETVHCLGCCALGPVVKVDDAYHSDPSAKQVEDMIASWGETEKQWLEKR